ncbi:MAG: translation elongation factor [Anoxybacillus sp.]|nr:translation elongation factor [Anoxybacillus sp.]
MGEAVTKTKNDAAWEQLFDKYRILQHIEQNGFYEITADVIRQYREPRLMCKFDHKNHLPDIFADHRLSILPISRSAYVIGDFSTFAEVTYQKMKPQAMNIPYDIETIQADDLYSESAALHFAYHSGMIDDFLGEETKHTVSGRMGSGKFAYDIASHRGHRKHICVNGAQIEVDGGYEGKTRFAVIEAKKEAVNDFNVRQLFYPFKVWKKRIMKEVVPIFFTHSNDVFSFFMYTFADENVFTSYRLVKQKDYVISHQKITVSDIVNVAKSIRFVPEPRVPFPQANSFARVVDLLGLLYQGDLSKSEITENYNFDKRQTDYYSNACIYLGLAEKYREGDEVKLALTAEGRRVMALSYREKYITLAEKILEHRIFYDVYNEYIRNGQSVSKDFVMEKMKQYELYDISSESTFRRRASTIIGWVKWIIDLPE